MKPIEVMEKLEEYFASGVQRVWVIYPPFSKVYDYDFDDLRPRS